MGLHVTYEDITTLKTDAYVNSSNRELIGYSGVDRLIHELGGEEFEKVCEPLARTFGCGESVITPAKGRLLCRYVIHTDCPPWQGGFDGESAILKSCYRTALELAEEYGLRSVAMPLIGAGSMRYPLDVALRVAENALREHIALYGDMDLTLALHGLQVQFEAEKVIRDLDSLVRQKTASVVDKEVKKLVAAKTDLDFAGLLAQLIAAHGIAKDSEVYKGAHMTRQTFNKIITGKSKPTKENIVKIAFSMKLPLREAEQLLAARGLRLTDSDTFDVIVKYYLEHEKYDLASLYEQLVRYGCEALIEL